MTSHPPTEITDLNTDVLLEKGGPSSAHFRTEKVTYSPSNLCSPVIPRGKEIGFLSQVRVQMSLCDQLKLTTPLISADRIRARHSCSAQVAFEDA